LAILSTIPAICPVKFSEITVILAKKGPNLIRGLFCRALVRFYRFTPSPLDRPDYICIVSIQITIFTIILNWLIFQLTTLAVLNWTVCSWITLDAVLNWTVLITLESCSILLPWYIDIHSSIGVFYHKSSAQLDLNNNATTI